MSTFSFRRGVTLIELLITMTIMAIISAAVLGTAASAIEKSRQSKTQSLIARIDGLMQERLASYETRRVELSQAIENSLASFPDEKTRQKARADMRLLGIRELLKMEMPDRWNDVINPPQVLSYRPGLSATYYGRYKAGNPSSNNQGAECLFLLIMNATGDGESRTLFSAQDIGDSDNDGFKEFHDGWGNPISWLRWPTGLAPTAIMSGNASADHDPLDPYQRDVDQSGRLANHFPRPYGSNAIAYPPAVASRKARKATPNASITPASPILNRLRSYTIMATVTTPTERPSAMATFCEQIRLQMEKRKLTHADVAKEAKVSRAYLYRILDGSQTPSMKVADRIAASLGLVITTKPAR